MKNNKLTPAEQIVAELAEIGFLEEKEDFLVKVRLGDWDPEQFEALMAKLKELKPVFQQLPDAVKALLDFYLMLPSVIDDYIRHSPEPEKSIREEASGNIWTVLSENCATYEIKEVRHWQQMVKSELRK